MDYEERYRKLIEAIKEMLEANPHDEGLQNWVQDNVPELAESEDERIRKELKRAIDVALDYNYFDKETANNCLAWLKKQGEQKSIINTPSREVILSIWDLGNEWKELTGGCISEEYGTQLDYIQKHWNESEYYLRETQGEHEKKPTDDVEPKFHEGDWVVYNHDICQIVKREEGCNKLVTVFGVEKELVNERNLSTARLWTIQDAKEGDILATKNAVFIFKHIDKTGLNLCRSYCEVIDNSGLGFGLDFSINSVYPATKEQRTIFFTNMKEAGFKFDNVNKELKKIE